MWFKIIVFFVFTFLSVFIFSLAFYWTRQSFHQKASWYHLTAFACLNLAVFLFPEASIQCLISYADSHPYLGVGVVAVMYYVLIAGAGLWLSMAYPINPLRRQNKIKTTDHLTTFFKYPAMDSPCLPRGK